MDDFERTEDNDVLFSSIGRALAVATQFEANCRNLAAILHMKANPSAILESEETLKEFSEKLQKRTLKDHIKSAVIPETDLFAMLDRARQARNEIAHEIALGLCSQSGINFHRESTVEGIRETITTIAEADRAVCYLLTSITNDHMPNNEFLESYPNRVTAWVCDD